MKRLTILQLVSDLRSAGAQQVVYNLAKGLQERDHRIIVGTFEQGDLTMAFRQKGISVVSFNGSANGRLRTIRALVSLLRRERVDLVHSHLWLANLYARFATQWCEIPLVITEHGRYVFQKRYRRSINRWMLKGAKKAIAVCEHLRHEFIDTNQVPSEKMLTIYNGIDLSKFSRPATRTRTSNNKSNGATDGPHIGIIGNLRPVKGHQFFLKAARQVLNHHPEARFLIIGEGPEKLTLMEQSSSLGIDDSVKFLGRRSDIPYLLSTLDVFVLSSLYEGLPISLLEAMAMSKPVIATSIGGIPEVINSGINGLLVPPKDHEALAENICELIQNETRARDLGISALETVRARFSLKTMLDHYEALYNKVLD